MAAAHDIKLAAQSARIAPVLASGIARVARTAGRFALDLAVPPACLSCDERVLEPGALCPVCWQKLRFITKPRCAILGTPFAFDLGPGIISARAIASPPPFTMARSAVLYDEIARKLVARLKYEDRPDLAPVLGRWMATTADDLITGHPLVVPVPLHRWRLLRRRYNQAALLARHVARRHQLEFQPLALSRIRPTGRQVGLTRRERADNVRGAFRATPQGAMAMSGRPVLLIDDVFTTGATIEAATRACLRAGAAKVLVLTFALVSDPLGSAAEGVISQTDSAELPIDLPIDL
uniref:ComF family protein n=1 Tax=Pararhizobium sp. IMCC3301 TaxID=3067904 RepID=UPI00274239AF|nr:ComF family protein [Pararhizobium sp. IMCC3301]